MMQDRTSNTAGTCPHRPPCGGCPRFGESDIAPWSRQALESLARAHGLPGVATVLGHTDAFRLRARLAIRGRRHSPKLGLFEPGSHHVVHIPDCRVQHPLINRVAAVVRRALVDSGVGCYSDTAHQGLARYLQVVIERGSQTAQVVLVGNSETAGPLAGCLDLIRTRLGGQLHSLWFNAQVEPTNTVLGPHFQHWHGPASVVERFGGAAIHYPPGAFGQSNLAIAQRIIESLRDQVPPDARVTEFHAGVGAIGLSLLDRVRDIRMNEISPQSLQGLELALAQLAPEDRSKVTVVPGTAGESCAAADGADVVIADPPRKGLDPDLTAYLGALPPQSLLYVSCSLESLLRDTALLTARGRLRLSGLTAFNLMPFTDHVETLARFERVD